MSITLKDLKRIKADLAKRKPPKPALAIDRNLTTKEIILALAPDLTKMKAKGFTTHKMVDILKEHKVNIKGATLNRYLAEHKTESAKRAANPLPTSSEESLQYFSPKLADTGVDFFDLI